MQKTERWVDEGTMANLAFGFEDGIYAASGWGRMPVANMATRERNEMALFAALGWKECSRRAPALAGIEMVTGRNE